LPLPLSGTKAAQACHSSSRIQNWDISKSRDIDTLADAAFPETIADAAERLGCRRRRGEAGSRCGQ
jgi:hypothetical protein